jgi:hypothetical protein
MKTRKTRKTLVPKQHPSDSSAPKPLHKIINGEFTPEEDLAEKHFSLDEEWNPVRKSKGADEEG